jgi:hypothetical protein
MFMINLSREALTSPLGHLCNWYMNTETMSESAHRPEEEAIKLLESQPEFARVELRMRKSLEELGKRLSPEATRFGTQARLKYVIERNEIRAKAFLELVSDINTQNAYIALLRCIVRAGFQEYTGFPMEGSRPVGQECQRVEALLQLVPKWEKAGYERLAKKSEYTPGLKSHDGRILSPTDPHAAETNKSHTEQAKEIINGWQAAQTPRLSNSEAARRLGISETALAALKRGNKRSAKTGKKRCGLERVRLVAEQIGSRPEQLDAEYLNHVK